jgi:hypothetical protein
MEKDIRPVHYKAGNGDVIDFCQQHNLNFQLGNVLKYVTRAGKKHYEGKLPEESMLIDLHKAKEYLYREITAIEAYVATAKERIEKSRQGRILFPADTRQRLKIGDILEGENND